MDYRNLGALFAMCEQVKAVEGDVLLDGQDVEFVDPLGIAVLGALLEPRAGSRVCQIDWLRTDIATYLARMKVLECCGIEGVDVRPFTASNQRLSLVELTKLTSADEVDEAAERLATAIAGVLVQRPADAGKYSYPLQYSLRELLLNALTHAKKEGKLRSAVWVAAQHYQKLGVVRVAVVDNGCGALATLKSSPKLLDKTHAGAIRTALEPFVTCNPETRAMWAGETANRGIGLTTTRRIASAANGKLVIASGNASLTADSRVREAFLPSGAHWEGMAILMTCQRSKLPSVNVSSLFPEVPAVPGFQPRFVD
jgi:hypothetical protein